jgi:hypothetical protein
LIAAVFGVGFVISLTGDRVLVWLKAPMTSALCSMTIVIGTALTSLFVVPVGFVLKISSGDAFLIWSTVILTAALIDHAIFARASATTRAGEVGAMLVLAALVVIWTRVQATGLSTLASTGRLTAWSDYYIHGVGIEQLGSPFVIGQGSMILAGEKAELYHYGFLAVSAIFAGFVDLAGLGLALAVLLPYGVFALVLGVYALATVLVSPEIGFIAAIAIMVLPDASTYWLGNGFFGFHWLIFTSPGNGYAIGIVCISSALLVLWRDKGGKGCLALAGVLGVAIFEMRAHIGALFAPAITASLVLESRKIWPNAPRICLGAAVVAVLSLILLVGLPPLRNLWLQTSAVLPFLETIHAGQSPTAYDGVYRSVTENFGEPIAVLAGLAVIPLLVVGLLIILLPVLMTLAIARGNWRPLDTLPCMILICYMGIVLFAPTPFTGDFTELKHRPFVLVYAVFLIWCISFAARAIRSPIALTPIAKIGVGAAISAVSCVFLARASPATPQFSWGQKFYNSAITPGLFTAARYVRRARARGDVFALLPVESEVALHDRATDFSSLVDLPAYLARAKLNVLLGGEASQIANVRVQQLRDIQTINDPIAARTALQTMGIQWLVTVGQNQLAFDPDAAQSNFRSQDVSVYHVVSTATNIRGESK